MAISGIDMNMNRKVMSVPLPYLKCSKYEQNLRVEYMFSRNKLNPRVQLSHIAVHLVSNSGNQKKKVHIWNNQKFFSKLPT